MKQLTLLFCSIIFLLVSCKDKTFLKYQANTPVYMDYESFRASVAFEGPRGIEQQGSISIKDQNLFIVEPEKGIHFIDNSNPSSPVKIGFLNVLGCSNMSIKGSYLYVNSLIDLVVVDISTITVPTVVNRLEDVFPQVLPPTNNSLGAIAIDKSLGVVIGWEVKTVKEEVEVHATPYWNNCPNCDMALSSGNQPSYQSSTTSISGSITKFAILSDHLYIVDAFRLIPVNISTPTQPIAASPIQLTRTVETLFSSGNHLFMGTTTGMLIFATDNPDLPVQISAVNHVTACDPVVVSGNYAYVTTRMGTTCAGTINQLDVIDITDLFNPYTVATFPMVNPHGLGIDGNRLFICDGSAGLKVFDATVPANSGNQLIQAFSSIQATDVIPYNNTAIVIGENGLYQYDYSDPTNLNLLSTILFH